MINILICRSFYKHILAKAVKHQDMESEDYEFYKNLSYLIDTKVEDMGYDMYFSTEIQVNLRIRQKVFFRRKKTNNELEIIEICRSLE